MKRIAVFLVLLLTLGCFTPALAAWTDLPADEWYSAAAAWCARTGLMTTSPNGAFHPEGTLTKGEVQDAMALACRRLLGESGPLEAPDGWGVAVISSDQGVPLLTFRAWEPQNWRTWYGADGSDSYHYVIAATREQLLTIFPNAEAELDPYSVYYNAVLDMGDRVLTGRLYGLVFCKGAFSDPVTPAFAFYPDRPSGNAEGENPCAPTDFFRNALPGGTENRDRIYYFREAGVPLEELSAEEAAETADRWYLAEMLQALSHAENLPKEPFTARFERNVPERESAYRVRLLPLYRAGLLLGINEEGYYAPEEPLTRAQLAAALYRLLNPGQRGK